MAPPKVIAVMGVTGVGKSSFIKLVTGNESIVVGDRLTSETATVETYKFRHKDRTIILVDTPGFDDTHRNDADVLKQLAAWFEETYKNGTKLSGIIYLHRITDDRMRGSSLRSMRMFRQLCGESFYSNLLLGTTCWSLISEDVGADREKELMTNGNFWKGLIGKGAQFVRIPDDGYEAKELVYDLARLEPASLQIQKEMVDGHVRFDSLSAAQTLEADLSALQAEQKLEKQRLEADHQRKLREQTQREQQLRQEIEQKKHRSLLEFRLKTEHETLANSRAKFTEGIQKNTYIAKLHPMSISLSTTCDHCCKWVGHQQYYVCNQCQDGKFTLCGECYQSGTAFCFYPEHRATMKAVATYDAPPSCRHTNFPIPSEVNFSCYRCAKNIEGVFAHCCTCLNDGFNMCLECLTSLGTCKKSWSLSGHRLYPLIRRCRFHVSDDAVPVSENSTEDGTKALFDEAGKLKEKEQWKEAGDTYLQVISQREKTLDIKDEMLRDSYYNLGLVYSNLGRTTEAIEKLTVALNGEEQVYGAEDSRTLYTCFELAKAYRKQKNHPKAIPLFKRAIGREAKLGIADMAVRNSYFELGLIREEDGQLLEACLCFESTLKGEEEKLGPDHSDTLITVGWLAKVSLDSKRFDDAEKYYKRLITTRGKTLGVDHKKVLDHHYTLGIVYRDMGNYASSDEHFNEALAGYEKTLSPNDEETLGAFDQRIKVLMLDSQYEMAADLCHTVLKRRKATLGPNHKDTQATEMQLKEAMDKIQSAMLRTDSLANTPSPVHAFRQNSMPPEAVARQNSMPPHSAMRQNSMPIDPISRQNSMPTVPTSPVISHQPRRSIPSRPVSSGLNGSVQQLVAALPQVSSRQGHQQYPPQIPCWDQWHLQMVLSGQLALESRDAGGQTAFMYAVSQNDNNSAFGLLNNGAVTYTMDCHGRTALHSALRNGNQTLTTVLLERGSLAMTRDVQGCIPLHDAATFGHTAVVSTFLAFSGPAMDCFDIEAQNQDGYTALHLASLHGHSDLVQVLMSHGASYSTMSSTRGTDAAHIAAQNGHADVLRAFSQWGCRFNSPSSTGMTALHYAAAQNCSQAAVFLIDSGVDVEGRSHSNGWTPLFYSTYHGHTATSQTLIQKGANMHAVEATGFPLFHTLAMNNIAAGLGILIQAGMHVETQDRIGNSPLLYAVQAKTCESLRLLLQYGANAGALETQSGNTALHLAAANGQTAAAQLLLSHGARVDVRNAAGLLPLHRAVMGGHVECVQQLLAANADVMATTRENYTAIQLATMYNQRAVIPLLAPPGQFRPM